SSSRRIRRTGASSPRHASWTASSTSPPTTTMSMPSNSDEEEPGQLVASLCYPPRKDQSASAFRHGYERPIALPVLRSSGRIDTHERADGAQNVQIQTQTHPSTGADDGVCRTPLPRTLQCCPARAHRGVAEMPCERVHRTSKRPVTSDQKDPARIL